MSPAQEKYLSRLEGRITALLSEQRALRSLGMFEEAEKIASVVLSLELLQIDFFNLHGPIVEHNQKRSAL